VVRIWGQVSKALSSQIKPLSNYLNQMYYELREGIDLNLNCRTVHFSKSIPGKMNNCSHYSNILRKTLSDAKCNQAIIPNGFIRTYEICLEDPPRNRKEETSPEFTSAKIDIAFWRWEKAGLSHAALNPAWGWQSSICLLMISLPLQNKRLCFQRPKVLRQQRSIVSKDTVVAILDLRRDTDSVQGRIF
jgi:hypothetical protein